MLTVVYVQADTIEYIINIYFTPYMRRYFDDDVVYYTIKKSSRREKLCEIFYLQASLPFSIYEYLNLSYFIRMYRQRNFQQDKQRRRTCI